VFADGKVHPQHKNIRDYKVREYSDVGARGEEQRRDMGREPGGSELNDDARDRERQTENRGHDFGKAVEGVSGLGEVLVEE